SAMCQAWLRYVQTLVMTASRLRAGSAARTVGRTSVAAAEPRNVRRVIMAGLVGAMAELNVAVTLRVTATICQLCTGAGAAATTKRCAGNAIGPRRASAGRSG